MTAVARTPDDRFAGLPDFPWEPRFVEVQDDEAGPLRLARIDEGPDDAHPVVMLHGEPTWSFLWRQVVPPLLEAGLRVVVPDQVGFGRSDKPERSWFTYDRLCATMGAHLDAAVGDQPVTLVVHDWGGPVGLRWAAEHRDRIARIVICNTGLYVRGSRMSQAWQAFRSFIEQADQLDVGRMVDGGAHRELPDEVRAAYDAPFPDPSYQGGVLSLPLLVPTSDDAPGADEQHGAMQELSSWHDGPPILCLWGELDPIIPEKVGRRVCELLPSALPFETVAGMHFLQEDAGPAIGGRIAGFVSQTSD